MEVSFETAKKEESARQAYLTEFLRKHPHPVVNGIIYNSQQEGTYMKWAEKEILKPLFELGTGRVQEEREKLEDLEDNNNLVFMFVSHYFNTNFGDGSPSVVFVNPCSFYELTEEGMRIALSAHEYTHAEDFQKGIKIKRIKIDYRNASLMNKAFFHVVQEVRAYDQELHEIRKEEKPVLVGKDYKEGYRLTLKVAQENWLDILKRWYDPMNELEEIVRETTLSTIEF